MIEWLDVCCPLPDGKSWLTVGYSAITKQQQFTTYDCGVACLLYAEKCGQEQVKTKKQSLLTYLNCQLDLNGTLQLPNLASQTKEDINDFTTQDNITEYRRTLRNFTNKISGMSIDLIV